MDIGRIDLVIRIGWWKSMGNTNGSHSSEQPISGAISKNLAKGKNGVVTTQEAFLTP